MRIIDLEKVENVRDIGGTPVAAGRMVAHGLLYRGSALHSPTEADCAMLFDTLGIRTVVDLRCGWERAAKPNRLGASAGFSAAVPIEQLHIPFYDKDIVGIEYTEPAAGTKVVGLDVACDPEHFYRSLANPLTTDQIRRALHAVLERMASGTPVYLHCSGGKDRTGIIAMLVLAVLGADGDAIVADYEQTNVARDRRKEHYIKHFMRFTDGDEDRARELAYAHRAWARNLGHFADAVCESYGSMDDYLRNQLQVDARLRADLLRLCTVANPAAVANKAAAADSVAAAGRAAACGQIATASLGAASLGAYEPSSNAKPSLNAAIGTNDDATVPKKRCAESGLIASLFESAGDDLAAAFAG